MKFAASYSGGKESNLAIHKAVLQGHEPIALITTFTTDADRSHSHGLSEEVLGSVSDALGIPLWLVKTSGEEYALNFERALQRAMDNGAEACVFGDVDIEGHLAWCTERCEAVGIKAMFPLWGKSRREVVYDLVDSGFVANIATVNTEHLHDDILGKRLTKDLAEEIAEQGACICGENGEYHTFVSSGPTFKYPVEFYFGEKAQSGHYTMLPVINGKRAGAEPDAK